MKIPKFKPIPFAIIIFLLILLGFVGCEYVKKSDDYDRVKNALLLSDLQNQKFTTERNKLNQEIASQKQVILSKNEALESQLVELEELREYKRLERKIVFRTKTEIDTIFIPYTPTGDTLDIELPMFRKPFKYIEQDGWYALSGTATNLGIELDSMRVENKYSLLIGDKKLGWFKKPSPEIQLINENPYTSTVSMNNVKIEYKLPFYKRNEFWTAIGVVIGWFLGGL